MKKLLCIVLCLLLTGCAAVPAETEPALTGSLQVQFYESGSLVQCNGEALLIDCGSSLTPEIPEEQGVQTLSAIWLTGSDDARAGGLEAMLEKFPARVCTPERFDGKTWLNCAAVTAISLGNELAVQIRFGQSSLLFTGDLSAEGQSALAEAGAAADVLILGSEMVLSETMLAAISPQNVILLGTGTAETLALLQNAGIEPCAGADYDSLSLELDGSFVIIHTEQHTSHRLTS